MSNLAYNSELATLDYRLFRALQNTSRKAYRLVLPKKVVFHIDNVRPNALLFTC